MTITSSALSLTWEGWAVRWVVTLVEPVADLIAEYDHHEIQAVGQQASSNSEVIQPTPKQQHTYCAYEKLMQWCPSVHKLVGPAAEADTAGLKVAFVCREHGRGFNHDIMGKLLCPVDYDWSNADVCSAIREFQPNFRITAHSWPPFLYTDGDYDLLRPAKGLFKGKYPVMVRYWYGSICSSWMIVDEDFNHEEFYHNIVDYFELPSLPQKAAELNDLLMWWNQLGGYLDVRTPPTTDLNLWIHFPSHYLGACDFYGMQLHHMIITVNLFACLRTV
ncbi:hypothetical protein EDD16DRAFT_1515381 [Pisolithus croceorrhizus]|nr:hypothetical protein EDD16DRAFT_1515381 [Pisolithus croceorrhizus]KAI6131349.1 hypothetical protein EV401DRAFT_1884038 [Pisolithus croceorrhizus]KAI6161191.1 hypothetical protein EDD17DRAFT_1509408 [Pisolithus thermaeus]